MKYSEPPNKHIPLGILSEKNIKEIVQIHSTPLYLYDSNIINKKVNAIIKKINCEVFYSVKANPFSDILNIFNKKNIPFEVTSIGEMLKLLENNISLNNAIFVGPGKTDADLEFSIRNNIRLVVVESDSELVRLNRICQGLHKFQKILLRINPLFNAGAMINMSGINQFGMEKEDVLRLLQERKHLYQNINFQGLHFYLGTNILNVEQLVSNLKNILKISSEIELSSSSAFEVLDIGGSFGIPYYENDVPLDLDAISLSFNSLINKYLINRNTKIIMELGRFLVGEAGIFVTKVIDIKINSGRTFVVLDGGTNFFGFDSRYRGFKVTPIKLLNSSSNERQVVTLVGSLCTSSDILANNILLPKIKVGDYIAFFQAGAYAYTASPVLFLSHTLPCEVLI